MANFIKAIPMASLDSATLTGAYAVINTGLSEACLILRIINDSSVDITVSYDGGVTDHDYVRYNTSLTINAQTNSTLPGMRAMFRKGLPIYIKGGAGQGSIYIAGYYS